MAAVKITAVSDVYTRHLKSGQTEAGADEVFATPDHRQLLERKDVDAVVLTVPGRHHVPMMIEAIQAGKDL